MKVILPPEIDQTPKGKRVKLVSIKDRHRWLGPGCEGTAVAWATFDIGGSSQRTLQIEWDHGPDVSLIEGIDEWEWTDE
jgi:hypothetical protein